MRSEFLKRTLLVLFVIILLVSPIFSVIVKSETYGSTIITGASGIEKVASIVVDHNKNVIITGSFLGTTNLEINTSNPKDSNGNYDIFIAKYNQNGGHVWSKTFGGKEGDYGNGVAVDKEGNIYVVGYFQDIVNFETVSKTSAGLEDIFIMKYSPDGTLQWVKTIGGTGNDYAYGVAVDSNNNLYVTGSFTGASPVNFNPDGSDIKSGFGTEGTDIFLSKWDSSGVYQWTKVIGGTGQDRGYRIAIDGSNNVYIAGLFFSSSIDFSLAGTDVHGGEGDGWYYYLSKWNADNTYGWTKTFGPVTNLRGVAIAVTNGGDAFIAGSYNETVNFNPDGSDIKTTNGLSDAFVSKWSASGVYQWTKAFGSTGDYEYVKGLGVNKDGDVVLTGGFSSAVNFNPNGSDIKEPNGDSEDVFISSWNSSGTYRWTKVIGGEGEELGLDLTVKDNNIYVAGMFNGTVDFNPDGGDVKKAYSSNDIFITMLKGDGPAPNYCKQIDINSDGILNYIDLASFAISYNTSCVNRAFTGDTHNCGSQDTDNDGVINYKDLSNFAIRYHTVKSSCSLK